MTCCVKMFFISVHVCPGTLQVRYSLGGLTEPFIIDVDHRNMANGQPHSVNITRNSRTIRLQVGYALRQSKLKFTFKCSQIISKCQ